MKQVFWLLLSAVLFCQCGTEDASPIIYDNDYGDGLYVLTEQGVTYYDYDHQDDHMNSNNIKENIFQRVNSHSISNPSSLEIINEDMYIVSSNSLYKVDISTFFKEMEVHGFVDAKKCENAKFNRIYVSDPGESEVKVIDLDDGEIIAHIKTGINVNPNDIAVNVGRAFIVNSGTDISLNYDSTMVAVNIKDGVVAINEFAGSVVLDKNPVSVLNDGAIIVLCKGIYDNNDPSQNIQSSINRVGAGSLNIINTVPLNNIYNANNLTFNNNKTKYYITSESGVYIIDGSTYNPSLVTDRKIPSSICVNVEQYANTDTTFAYSEILYMNNEGDLQDKYIYKYNVQLDQFVDSFMVNSKILDLKIH